MRIVDRTLLIAAGAAILTIGVAIFTLREDPIAPASSSLSPQGDSSTTRSDVATRPSDVPSAEEPAPDYFPLSDGFRRNYLVEVSYRGGPPRFGMAKLEVEGRETIREKEYFKVLLRVTGITEMRDAVLRYCRRTDDGWLEVDGRQRRDPAFETVTLPLPPRVGIRWDTETPEERGNWKVEGTETVELLGKSYPKCLRISYERRLTEEPDYFESGHYLLAPNVGLIQQVAMASGTRLSFTLDDRPPEAIAFYTTWAGTYEGVARGATTGGKIQLFANGRYTMIRSWSDSAVDSGTYERNSTREGELILRDDKSGASTYSYRRNETGPGPGVLVLRAASGNGLPGEDYLRDAPGR